jgi:hypothetical protein
MPCEHCGASIDRRAAFWHLCDGERWLDFKLFELRGEIASFEDGLGRWLATPRGRFEQFYAERERRRPTID